MRVFCFVTIANPLFCVVEQQKRPGDCRGRYKAELNKNGRGAYCAAAVIYKKFLRDGQKAQYAKAWQKRWSVQPGLACAT
jgi:hypothetical protein